MYSERDSPSLGGTMILVGTTACWFLVRNLVSAIAERSQGIFSADVASVVNPTTLFQAITFGIIFWVWSLKAKNEDMEFAARFSTLTLCGIGLIAWAWPYIPTHWSTIQSWLR
jgi:hypothetical protein